MNVRSVSVGHTKLVGDIPTEGPYEDDRRHDYVDCTVLRRPVCDGPLPYRGVVDRDIPTPITSFLFLTLRVSVFG